MFTLEQATKAQRGSRGIALLFFNSGASLGVGGQGHAPVALPPGKRPGIHCTRSWFGLAVDLDGYEEYKNTV